MKLATFLPLFVVLLCFASTCRAQDDPDLETLSATVEADLGKSQEASRTDDEAVQREEEAIKLDGLNVAQIKELRDRAEKHQFQAEVNRMMKLIINSLYRNKEIFLRELISNASDALDKIRLISLTDPDALAATDELTIRIKADKDNKILHITDTGIGMTKQDLTNNLGTIAKSGTAEFLNKLTEAENTQQASDMIGQFGVGFYSSFLVADRVVVTSKHNDDIQYIWESDAGSFTIVEDPRGNTLQRGTTISLYLKEEALDYLEQDTIKNLVKKYSQFISFPIYLWSSKTEKVEEPLEEEEEVASEEKKEEEDADAQVEEEKDEEKKPKTKTVEKTTWDWEQLNTSKPIWLRKPNEVSNDEYAEFYKSITKDSQAPLGRIHFVAEGEVSFKAVLFVPKVQPSESFNRYGTKMDNIKLYVRRVFITDDFQDLLPSYLSFLRGIIDSDDLPLNVSRETLQQHKLLKVIKKKVVRKALDMIKKLDNKRYQEFWKEYSTNIKLGIIEDPVNRSRLAKLLRFQSSATNKGEYTSLEAYVSRMKPKQEHIYYMGGQSREEVESSPFVERVLKRGYEVIYLTEAVDEYAASNLPEFEGKKFQSLAKDGVELEEDKEKKELLEKQFEPLVSWLNTKVLAPLSQRVAAARISERLTDSPAVLVTGMFSWSANMERLALANAHTKTSEPQREFYFSQRKTLEINPRHPLIKEMLRRVENDEADETLIEMSKLMIDTATLRSGYVIHDSAVFANNVEQLMRKTLNIPSDEQPEEDPSDALEAQSTGTSTDEKSTDAEEDDTKEEDNEIEHEEL